MGLNNPIPRGLKAESKKAAKILTSFIKPNQVFGADQVIPPDVLKRAQGLAIITVFKAGFLFSGRGGSGVLVARLPNGHWSAPSAIAMGGAGAGGMAGLELTDFVFILNTKDAVKSFSEFGTITLGGNVSVSAGPLGRNAEAAASASSGGFASVFSYSKSKGLYAGVSLEGSAIIERRDANRKYYGDRCTSKDILSGRIKPPAIADPLLHVLESRAFNYRAPGETRAGDDYDIDDFNFSDDVEEDDYNYSRDNSNNSRRSNTPMGAHNARAGRGYYDDADDDCFNDAGSNTTYNSGDNTSINYKKDNRNPRLYNARNNSSRSTYNDEFYSSDDEENYYRSNNSRSQYGRGSTQRENSNNNRSYTQNNNSSRWNNNSQNQQEDDSVRNLSDRLTNSKLSNTSTLSQRQTNNNLPKAVALYTFDGEERGDLSFRKGDIIVIIKKSESQDDWWSGRCNGEEGIFPANYVELV
ncbi:hypothetical protein TBLA_0D04950 [Henningerozyma blattae CBS 6284]|uniref:SH3 domain-containing protein n=1 Tax=Henningerozyma blattae (strain ATCC 34711 / CBS 6284 / DSM 70876 / NBRC 10599 / NRRL Y-10934 / UCD 77-7) TaxID=1071380 RepID=I2H3N8_HENB6|nr:hypothetical protein TBLA_0D04950 [Tetrapisispora blattae CBS 6284]CCH60990.1 hypothetical protein TBLA_0D04950 [Tetrapisispora blattae CBS 6284]